MLWCYMHFQQSKSTLIGRREALTCKGNSAKWRQRATQQWFGPNTLQENWRYTHPLWTDKNDLNNLASTFPRCLCKWASLFLRSQCNWASLRCAWQKKTKQQQPFTGLKGSTLNILVPDTIAHPQGATWRPCPDVVRAVMVAKGGPTHYKAGAHNVGYDLSITAVPCCKLLLHLFLMCKPDLSNSWA